MLSELEGLLICFYSEGHAGRWNIQSNVSVFNCAFKLAINGLLRRPQAGEVWC